MNDIAYGYCHCGCGAKTNIARDTNSTLGHVRGKPFKYLRGHSGRTYDPRAPFKSVDAGYDTPCKMWQGATDKGGYGRRNRGSGTELVHKQEWEALHGPTPDGYELDHLCRTHGCAEPTHLELVTHAENLQRGDTGKSPGSRGNNFKLTDEDGKRIRYLLGRRYSRKALADEYGVSTYTIGRIARSEDRWV